MLNPMTFDFQPTLRGALVELRPLRPDDFEPLFAVASDPLIWEQHPAWDRYKPAVFREFFHVALASGAAFAVLDRRDGGIVGSSRYHAYDPEKSRIEIGWTFLARSHWGGRFNGEMKQLMVRHALSFVERVIFVIGVGNLRSQKAIEKLGGARVGQRTDAAGHDSFVYEMGKVPAIAVS